MKLSIVIPMYNAGQFIGNCLDSCMNQDLAPSDYEVIIVNDGSTDNGVDVAEGMIESHGWDNVRIVSRVNGGLSEARNTGLDHAEGDFIWFVDADDWIETGCLGKLVGRLDSQDVLVFGAVDYFQSDGGVQKGTVFQYPEETRRSGPEHISVMSERLKMCAPFCILKRSFLAEHNLRFVPGLLHEDAEFMPRTINEARVVHVTPLTPYCRLVRAGSLSRDNNPTRFTALLEVATRLHDYKGSDKVGKGYSAPFNSIISNVLNQSFKYVVPNKASGYNLKDLKWIKGTFLSSKEFKYKLEGILISLFPNKPVEVFSFLSSIRNICGKVLLA